MPQTLPKSRLRKLLIAFAITTVCVTAFHISQFGLPHWSSVVRLGGFPARRHLASESPNYSKIEDGLWMGGHVDQPPAGTQAVLNLCEAKDSYQVESSQVATIPDGPPAPSIEWLGRQVAFIESERAAGHTVYVHCYAGVSRAGLVMAAYFMRREGWSADQAIHFLQSKRPVVNPNPVFRLLLAEWERSVKGTGESIPDCSSQRQRGYPGNENSDDHGFHGLEG